MKPRVSLEIERVVISGLDRNDRRHFSRGFHEELEARLANIEVQTLGASPDFLRVNLPVEASAEQKGRALAQAIVEGLSQ